MNTNITAIILAGGLGSRLRPFTYSIPKPLIKVQRKPILEYTIENLVKHNIKNIILAVDYKSHKIQDYFKEGKELNANISYAHRTGHLGTGGAIKIASEGIKNTFIIVNGDNVANYNWTKMLKEHKREKAKITLAILKQNDVSQYGVVKLKNKRIIEFVEKPKKGKEPSNYINAGAYILEPSILKDLPNTRFSLEKDYFEKVVKNKKIIAFIHKGQWYPTDNFERFFIANKKLDKDKF